MKYILTLVTLLYFSSCQAPTSKQEQKKGETSNDNLSLLAQQVKDEMLRSWQGYKQYAWGYDVLLPLSKKGYNWYDQTLGHISL